MIFSNAEGQITKEAPQIDFLDHGFLFGDSLYEVVRLFDGKIFAWDPHIKRLLEGADAIRLEVEPLLETIKQRVVECFRAFGEPNAACRIVITRGVGPLHINPQPCKTPRLYLAAWKLDESLLPESIKLAVPERRRNHIRTLSPALKSGNYLNSVMGLDQALQMGFDDCLFINPDDEITELSTSNVMWCQEGQWFTPDLKCGILDGITRQFIMKVLSMKPVHAGIDEIKKAEEVAAISTIKNLIPVSSIRFEDGSEKNYESREACMKAKVALEATIGEALKMEESILA